MVSFTLVETNVRLLSLGMLSLGMLSLGTWTSTMRLRLRGYDGTDLPASVRQAEKQIIG